GSAESRDHVEAAPRGGWAVLVFGSRPQDRVHAGRAARGARAQRVRDRAARAVRLRYPLDRRDRRDRRPLALGLSAALGPAAPARRSPAGRERRVLRGVGAAMEGPLTAEHYPPLRSG